MSAAVVAPSLTCKLPVLPSESVAEYHLFVNAFLQRYEPKNLLDNCAVTELADLHWRLRRAAAQEAAIINLEMKLILRDEQEAASKLDQQELQALAYTRLNESRVLPNLFSQEGRLSRRAEKLQKALEMENRKNEPNPPPPVAETKPTITHHHKVGRNEPCPCGSTLKFKRCCGNPLKSLSQNVLHNIPMDIS
jgi:hypothetical protein